MTRDFVISSNGGFAHVLVTISSGLENHHFRIPMNVPVLDVIGSLYYPPTIAVMSGQAFQIRTTDPFLHTVMANTKVNTSFSAVLPVGPGLTKSFALPERFIRLVCPVHPWESAHVCVEAHPYFCLTDTNGVFALPSGLPAGTFQIEAFHPKAGRISRTVHFNGHGSINLHYEFRVRGKP